jgi:hypothetical protein
MLDIRYIAMGDSSNAILGNDGTPLLLDTTKTAHERYEVSATTALYLIRPDGYIGYRSSPSDIEGVIEYMNRVLGVTPEMLRETFSETVA